MNTQISMFPESSHILKGENIRNYVEGGHAVVTLKSPTGKHYTYAFNKPTDGKYTPDKRFVKVHYNNEWVYLGMYYNSHYQSCFKKSDHCLFPDFDEVIKGVKYIIKMCNTPNLVTPMELYHEGVCCRCGRRLTDPKFIERGIGPKCAKMSMIGG